MSENSQPINNTANISVVIPHYNSSNTIFRAVSSILEQTLSAREIIIVDDGSTQKHKKQLESILSLSPQVQLLSLDKNRGPASARNAGWRAAQGTWIAFLDADDAWHPRKLEIQMRVAKNSSESIAMIGSEIEVSAGIQKSIDWNLDEIEVSKISTWKLLWKNRFSTPTVVLKKDLPFRFTEGRKYSEDYELWLRISGMKEAAIKVNLPLVLLFKAPYGESGLSSHMVKMSLGELETLRRLYKSQVLTLPQYAIGGLISCAKSVRRITLNAIKKTR